MIALLILLWGIIAAYAYYTNEARVRNLAAAYLGQLLGGEVRVGGADLSFFEGLRLDSVQIMSPAGPDQPPLLQASTVYIHYNLRALLAGRLEATQIIAVNPRMRLAQNLDTGLWNFQLLQPGHWQTPNRANAAPPPIPEVLLRDAEVDYLEGYGGKPTLEGAIFLDGRFGPAAGKYEFSFQSRMLDSLGPTIAGEYDPANSKVLGDLRNVSFIPQVQAMLPRQVRQWCQDHRLAGSMSVRMSYVLNSTFRVEAELAGVDLAPDGRPQAQPLMLHDATGSLVFTPQGITVRNLSVRLDHNPLAIDGVIGGYSLYSALNLSIRSLGEFQVPKTLPWRNSLPPAARQIYDRFHPSGRGTADIQLVRAAAGEPIHCRARVDCLDGAFNFADIPYPLGHATGQLLIDRDPQLGFDVLRLVNLHAHGPSGSANEKADLVVNGWIGPFNQTAGGRVTVVGRDFHYEPAVRQALVKPSSQAIALLDPHARGFGDHLNASFAAVAERAGAGKIPGYHWDVDTNLAVTGGQATYAGFDYPLDNIAANLEIGEGFVIVSHVEGHHGPAVVKFDGRIATFGGSGKFSPDLHLTVQNMPIDESLKAALPPKARDRLETIGAVGNLDIIGTVQSGYDLHLLLRDGSLTPHGRVAATDLTGQMRLTPDRLDIAAVSGRHGTSPVSGSGWIKWVNDREIINVEGHAHQLPLDEDLSSWLGPQAKRAWQLLRPSGNADATVHYNDGDVQMSLTPQNMAVSPNLWPGAKPFALQDLNGQIDLEAGKYVAWKVSGRRGQGVVSVGGNWALNDPNAAIQLRLRGENLLVDDELTKSMPQGLAQVLQILKLHGTTGFDFTNLTYRPAAEPDVDFAARVNCKNGSLDIGVPLSGVDGSAELVGSIRGGRLEQLTGDIRASSLLMAGRQAGDMSAKLNKPADEETVHISDLQARLAGGRLAGDLAVTLEENGPGRYAASLALEDADVRQLTSEAGNLKGDLSASLQLSGTAGQPSAQRGRGDVRVVGDKMYQIPLVFGLFQVTNLSLPVATPFDHAAASYFVQGQRVVIEQIQISSKDMTMEGSGHIDFGTKDVEMTFATDSPDWLALPLVGAVWKNARSELMRIHVKGSLKSPQVSASSLDTFTTTVDQVFKSEPAKPSSSP